MAQKQLAQHSFSRNSPSCFAPSSAVKHSCPSHCFGRARPAQAIWEDHLIWPRDYDKPMCERYWGDRWELVDGPCAKAYHLLRSTDVGPEIGSTRRPRLEFDEGAHPGNNSLWVNAMDQLSLSLLQARLIDLKLPMKVVEGT